MIRRIDPLKKISLNGPRLLSYEAKNHLNTISQYLTVIFKLIDEHH